MEQHGNASDHKKQTTLKQNRNDTISQCPLEPGPKLPMAHRRNLLQMQGEINTKDIVLTHQMKVQN